MTRFLFCFMMLTNTLLGQKSKDSIPLYPTSTSIIVVDKHNLGSRMVQFEHTGRVIVYDNEGVRVLTIEPGKMGTPAEETLLDILVAVATKDWHRGWRAYVKESMKPIRATH